MDMESSKKQDMEKFTTIAIFPSAILNETKQNI